MAYFNIKNNFDVLKSKSPCILVNKNFSFSKIESQSKMENRTHSCRETNLVFQLIQESQIKSKTEMSWSLRKINEGMFVPFILSEGIFLIYVLSQCIVYWIHVHTIHCFTLLHTLFCLLLKSSKDFGVSLRYYATFNIWKTQNTFESF